MTLINTIISLYTNSIFRYARISVASIIFIVCCAINYQWFNFTDSWFPFKKYLNIDAINIIKYTLSSMEAFFPLLTGMLFIILCIHLSVFCHQLLVDIIPQSEIPQLEKREKIVTVSRDVSKYLIMNFWLYYFIIRTIIFSNFSLTHPFSIGWHWLSPNYYLVCFFSLFAILEVIFAPVHYRHAKRRKLEAYLKRYEKMLTKNDKSQLK
ncbi:hypothetical protein LQZ24_01410 [Fructobacillus sp. M1-13]|uniref:Integral membrane protein n=1 Tax=Fructobacillus papyriferae TaxID=2713171 RepID=A0ABS5QNQ7_9LACO|nr:hypothetical protein [Fructobacillus papyriferae]MBS9334695.1 hypothetical protein [Fructobacillus papyriferae]MCD2158685.1 hypothetical protein [Fructobacillus papyriferae]